MNLPIRPKLLMSFYVTNFKKLRTKVFMINNILKAQKKLRKQEFHSSITKIIAIQKNFLFALKILLNTLQISVLKAACLLIIS
jgi:hypothetical protein